MTTAEPALPPPPDRLARTRRRLRRLALTARLTLADLGPGVRRAIDVVAAGAALLLLAPLLPILALAMKLDSRGPIFYWQLRVGQHGRTFRMPKLRTMVVDAEQRLARLAAANPAATDGVRFKLRRDPRVTRVGRWLRKLSIDELPQLWNVVRGDMTLVGPRPPIPREVALYDARALRRLEVRPGLTCLWQVGGRSDLSFEQQVELDLAYVDRVRPLEELLIVLRTVPAVLTGRGAY